MMQCRAHLIRRTILVAVVALATTGCSSYYAVKDLNRDKTYYATELHRASGTLRFVDAKTGATVTIKESEVREISQAEFNKDLVQN